MPLVPPVTQGRGPEEDEDEDGNHVRGRSSRLTAGRLHRLIEDSPILGNQGGGLRNPQAMPVELGHRGALTEWPEVLPVTTDAIVALMKRVVFFRGAQTAHADCKRTMASWFEVQYVEPFTTIAEEGHWCHSFVLLHTGALEARGAQHGASARVGRGTSILGNRTIRSQAEGGVDGRPLTKEERGLVRSSLALGEALPVPTVSGEYDSLEPVLLLPGAHFGEQAFCTEMRPHTCSVRTLERCVLLVLRRDILAYQLPELPNMARIAWAEQRTRHDALYGALADRWIHHTLRRLHVIERLHPIDLWRLEAMVTYRVLAPGATLLRPGERVSQLTILMRGELGLHQLGADDAHERIAASMRVSFRGAPPLLPNTAPPLLPNTAPPLLLPEDEDAAPTDTAVTTLSSTATAPFCPGRSILGKADSAPTKHRPATTEPARALLGTARATSRAPLRRLVTEASAVPPLRRLLTEASAVPLVGDEPLMLSTAAAAAMGAPSEFLVRARTPVCVAVLEYSALARRAPALLTELRQLVAQARMHPSSLMAALQQPLPPPPAPKGKHAAATTRPTRRFRQEDIH